MQVARCNALHFKVLGGIACQLEDFGRQVFENCSRVHGSLSANTDVILGAVLQVTVNTADGKLGGKEMGVMRYRCQYEMKASKSTIRPLNDDTLYLQASASRARQCWDLLTALFYDFLSGGSSFGSKVCVGLVEVEKRGKRKRRARST